jgi:hypothetical protein
MECVQRNWLMAKGDTVDRGGEGGGEGRRHIINDVQAAQRCVVMQNGRGFDLNGASNFKPRADFRAQRARRRGEKWR